MKGVGGSGSGGTTSDEPLSVAFVLWSSSDI